MTHRLDWYAAPDGLAHAARPGHARAVCGARAVDPRWAWPTRTFCAACVAAIDGRVTVRRVDAGERHR